MSKLRVVRANQPALTVKTCRWCYREKPITAFYKNADKCKPCSQLYAKLTKQIREVGLALVRQ